MAVPVTFQYWMIPASPFQGWCSSSNQWFVLLLCYFVDTLILWYFDTLLILWYFDTLIFCWYFDTLMTLSSVLILCWNLNLEFSAWHLFYWNLILEVNSCLRFLRHWISARFQWRRSGLLSLNFWDIVPELINWYWILIIQGLPIIWIITYNWFKSFIYK